MLRFFFAVASLVAVLVSGARHRNPHHLRGRVGGCNRNGHGSVTKKPTHKPSTRKPTHRPTTRTPTKSTTWKPATFAPTLSPTSDTPLSYKLETLVVTPNISTNSTDIIERARAKWNRVILNSLPGSITIPAGSECYLPNTAQNHDIYVKDLLVFVAFEFDGLASSGTCVIYGGFTRVALVNFNRAFFEDPNVAYDLKYSTAIHEFGHAVGIGDLWNTDTHTLWYAPNNYTGANGTQGMHDIGANGTFVPTELDDGGHWSADSFPLEVMNPYLTLDSRLSALSVKSLRDYGYTIDENEIEPYVVSVRNNNDTTNVQTIYLGDDRLEPLSIVYTYNRTRLR